MTTPPERPIRGTEFQPLENTPRPPDPYAPVDYPTDYPPLPPPAYPAPYPGYAANPYDPYRQGRPLGTNGWAIAALVTSLVSLVFCGLTSVIGLILGLIAMRDTKRSGQDGFGIALAGTIIGAIPILLWVLYWLFFVVLVASGFQWAP
ncbi:MAG: DUF4190 domain-containing protein [Mycobacterium sp.]